MRAGFLLVFVVLVSTLLAGCAAESTPEPTAVPILTADPGAFEARVFENDDFTLNLPEGWGVSMSGRDYYDLGTVEMVTFHDKPLAGDSGAYLTVSTVKLAAGEDLERRVNGAYSVQMTEIKDLVIKPYESDGLAGIEATYSRPWGEPWWRFRDVWFEKDGTSYLLSFRSYPNTFDRHAESFDAILASFHFND